VTLIVPLQLPKQSGFVVLIVGNGKVGGPGKRKTVSVPKDPNPQLLEFHPALHDG
jgi:hypothetical protein